MSKRTLDLVGDLIRRERNRLGTRWRKAAPDAQALIVLAVLRHDQRLSEMAGGSQVSASTVLRWVLEVLRLLAARAPRLDRALNKDRQAGRRRRPAGRHSGPHPLPYRGGCSRFSPMTSVFPRWPAATRSPPPPCAAGYWMNRKNYSGKHKSLGLLFLALTDEKGNLIWISSARPGRSSEITTARHDKITAHLGEAGLGALADLGFVGLDDDPDDHPVIITGRKAARNHRLTDAEKKANRLLSRERAAVEHGFANLKSWRCLTKIRMNTRHATTLLRALLVLVNTEVQR
ncbi:transposase family protein [Streptomyces pseudovenezuelae]|uniref:transposase family protein n=1 Tax=Streptomyces pseudovenezuelae TaxID=67350 RepID=UPI0036E46C4A